MANANPQARQRLIEGSMLSAGVLLAAALLVLVNYFAARYYQRFDWTKTKLYSLSEKSLNITKALTKDIKVVVFTSPGAPLADETQELLSRYQAASPRIQVEMVDPVKNLARAETLLQQYGTRYAEGSLKVVFDSGADRRIFSESDLADLDYSAMEAGGRPEIAAFKGEEVFTGALMQLAEGRKPKVLFTTGHGEKPLNDASGRGLQGVQELLGRDNVSVEEWGSLGKGEVPDGTDLVIVAGPTTGFVPPELETFGRYLAKGGRMLWLLDPLLTADGQLRDLGVTPWLAGYGVKLGNDVVIDPGQTVPFFGAETFFVTSFDSHPVSQALAAAQLQVIFALARSVAAGEAKGYEVTALARTSADGWGETDLKAIDRIEKGAGDTPGPVSVAVAVEGEGDAKARLVVVGDSDFAADNLLASAANSILVNNLVNWLVARESALGIPPKKPEQARLSITPTQQLTIYGIIALLPILAIVAGTMVYFRRRR